MINISVASEFSEKKRKQKKYIYIYKETFIKVTQTSAMLKIAVVIVSDDDDVLRKQYFGTAQIIKYYRVYTA